jgi:hypothetical protein
MVEKSTQEQEKQSGQNTSDTPKEKPLSQRLKEMPYSTENIGKGFVMSSPLRKKETQPSQDGKKD